MQALHLWREGWKQRDIAMALDVTEGAVSQWLTMARNDGAAALWTQPRPDAPAKLTLEQKPLIPDFLWHGAEAYGLRGEFWTCLRMMRWGDLFWVEQHDDFRR